MEQRVNEIDGAGAEHMLSDVGGVSIRRRS